MHIIGFLWVGFVLGVTPLLADEVRDMEMDVQIVQKTAGGDVELRGHYFMTDRQYRFNMLERASDGTFKMTKYQLYDERKNLIYTVVPSEKIYFVNSLVRSNPWEKDRLLKEKGRFKTGEETVEGLRCNVYEVVDKESKTVTRIWENEKVMRFPVKVIQKKGADVIFSLILSNIKFGPIDRAVFRVPKGFKKQYIDLDDVRNNIAE